MNFLMIFIWVYLAMIAMSFWESEVEGRKAWDDGKLGFKLKLDKYCIPAYHIFLFWVMIPLLLSLPLVINGWNLKLAGILASAYFSGIVIEDFMWFVVNPAIKFKESFNPKFANYYPWLIIGIIKIPILYLIGIGLSLSSWYFFWK